MRVSAFAAQNKTEGPPQGEIREPILIVTTDISRYVIMTDPGLYLLLRQQYYTT